MIYCKVASSFYVPVFMPLHLRFESYLLSVLIYFAHNRDKASVTNVKIQKHKSSLPNTSTPVNVLLGEPINAADVKLVS